MKHLLLEYERNGYHDSDFFAVYFDDEKNSIGQQETGSTRYAGGRGFEGLMVHKEVPADILEQARVALECFIYSMIRVAEYRDVLTPEPAAVHDLEEMRVLEDSSPRARKNHYKAGAVGEVFWKGSFGKFYKSGYNRPSRSNTTVGLRLLDGSRVFVPLSKCRLNREPWSDAMLRERAVELSRHYNFGAAVPGYTWASDVYFKVPKDARQSAPQATLPPTPLGMIDPVESTECPALISA